MSFADDQSVTAAEIKSAEQLPSSLRDAYVYWDGLRGSAWAPPWAGFRLEDLPIAVLPWSVVVDVERDPVNFRYRFWGTERTDLIGIELTGLRATDIPQEDMREGNIAEYQEVCERKHPLLCQTPITTNTGRNAVFRSIRLPLSADGEDVTHIFSAIDYEQISTAHYELFGTIPDSRVPDPEMPG